jgi:hypothetical protein
MTYPTGGLVSGPDPTPIYTETMAALARWYGYVIPEKIARELGVGSDFLMMLNEKPPPTTP